MTPTEQRKEWRAIAEKATPGPWAYGYWSGMCKIKHQHGGHGVCKYEYELMEGEGTNIVLRDEPVTLVTSTSEYCEFSKENAAHVATFNPATVIGLLDELDTKDQHIHDTCAVSEELQLLNMKLDTDLTAAQARIKALEELLGDFESSCHYAGMIAHGWDLEALDKLLLKIRSTQAKEAT